MRSSTRGEMRPCPFDTAQASRKNQSVAPPATPMTQATRSSRVRSTQLCARNVAVSVTHRSSTEGLPSTRTKPVMKAECGRNFCSMRSALWECSGMDLARKYFHERKSRKRKLNSSIVDFTMGRPRKAEKPVREMAQ